MLQASGDTFGLHRGEKATGEFHDLANRTTKGTSAQTVVVQLATFGGYIDDRSEVHVETEQPKRSPDQGTVFGGFFGSSDLFRGRERFDDPTKAIDGSSFLVDTEHHLRAEDLSKSGEEFAHLQRRLYVAGKEANSARANVLKQFQCLSVELRARDPNEE